MQQRKGTRRKRARPGRRAFLCGMPAAVAGAFIAPATGGTQPEPANDGLTAGALECAEAIAGLQFTGAEREMMLPGVTRNLESYRQLRALEIAPDVEPAFAFRPYVPDGLPPGSATPNAPIRLRVRPAHQPAESLEELAFLPVAVLASLIQDRTISSTDLTRMYLDRLRRYGERLHAVITLTEDLALAQAAEADREIRDGRYRGPLHGIPWGAKDLFATRGIRTTWGATPYEHQIIDTDATVVERLRAAGAVLVAKLSMGALAMGGVWFGGSTRNPWDAERSSSGSSAGSGAATAAGLVGFALGTETLGSIISPSTVNGVTGLRPTFGRVSRYGAMALSWTMDKVGPMCREVEDCAIVLNAIYGPDGRDETVADAPFAWEPDRSVSELRIGYVAREFDQPPEGAGEEQRRQWALQQPALLEVLDVFKRLGARLEPMALPDFPAGAIRFVLSAEAATAFDDLTRSRGIDELTAQEPGDWPNTFRTSRFIPAVEYIRAQRARGLLMREMHELMTQYDVFLSPTRSASLLMTNLTGHPAIALKAGFVEGRPLALMITGRLHEEGTLLRAALAYEQATAWHRMHPTLAPEESGGLALRFGG